jgi:O-antigen ligase
MGAAIDPYFPNNNKSVAAHNATIGLLVQVGIVGLVLFAGIFGACAWTIFRSPLPYAALCGVLLLTWLVGSMSDNLENRKITWLLFGLVAAQSGLANTATGLVRQRHQYRSGNNATGAMPRAPSAADVVPQAARIQ